MLPERDTINYSKNTFKIKNTKREAWNPFYIEEVKEPDFRNVSPHEILLGASLYCKILKKYN